MNGNVETTCWTSVEDADREDGERARARDRGRTRLQREFRVKRHEKLTGSRFDVASNFRCTGDRSSRDRVDYSLAARTSLPRNGMANENGGEREKGRKTVLNFSLNDHRTNPNFTSDTLLAPRPLPVHSTDESAPYPAKYLWEDLLPRWDKSPAIPQDTSCTPFIQVCKCPRAGRPRRCEGPDLVIEFHPRIRVPRDERFRRIV